MVPYYSANWPGPMMMQMLGAFAEFERAMLRERTKAGLDNARRQGRIGGRLYGMVPTATPPCAPSGDVCECLGGGVRLFSSRYFVGRLLQSPFERQ
jgi:hypothetical protein